MIKLDCVEVYKRKKTGEFHRIGAIGWADCWWEVRGKVAGVIWKMGKIIENNLEFVNYD